jgi:cysteine-rich repeat protein
VYFETDQQQRTELRTALLNAYPSYGTLALLIQDGFGKNLASISSQSNPLPEVTDSLLIWAEAEGKVNRLIRQARRYNLGNPKLKEFESKHLASFSTQHLIEIETIVGGQIPSTENLLALYETCQPLGWELTPEVDFYTRESGSSLLVRLLEILALANKQTTTESFPLLHFVSGLSILSSSPVKEELSHWLTQFTSRGPLKATKDNERFSTAMEMVQTFQQLPQSVLPKVLQPEVTSILGTTPPNLVPPQNPDVPTLPSHQTSGTLTATPIPKQQEKKTLDTTLPPQPLAPQWLRLCRWFSNNRKLSIPVTAASILALVAIFWGIPFIGETPKGPTTKSDNSLTANPKPTKVNLLLTVTPTKAKVSLGGKELSLDKGKLEIEYSEQAIILKIEAECYKTQEIPIIPNQDITQNIALTNQCKHEDLITCNSADDCEIAAREHYNADLYVESFTLYKKACNLGQASSCYKIGEIYELGNPPLEEPNRIESDNFYEKSCTQGQVNGCLKRGDALKKENKVKDAKKYYDKACSLGSKVEICSKTKIPICGNGTLEKDETCDDGNKNPGDGCSAKCKLETCTLNAKITDIEDNSTGNKKIDISKVCPKFERTAVSKIAFKFKNNNPGEYILETKIDEEVLGRCNVTENLSSASVTNNTEICSIENKNLNNRKILGITIANCTSNGSRCGIDSQIIIYK